MRKTSQAAAQPVAFLDPTMLPELYGLRVKGGCMAPDYPDGCSIKISQVEPYARGDVVCVWFRPEVLKPGGFPALIKRMVMMPPPWVTAFPHRDNPRSEVSALLMLGTNDRPDKMLEILCADVIAIHKVLGILTPEESFKASPEPFMRRRRRAG